MQNMPEINSRKSLQTCSGPSSGAGIGWCQPGGKGCGPLSLLRTERGGGPDPCQWLSLTPLVPCRLNACGHNLLLQPQGPSLVYVCSPRAEWTGKILVPFSPFTASGPSIPEGCPCPVYQRPPCGCSAALPGVCRRCVHSPVGPGAGQGAGLRCSRPAEATLHAGCPAALCAAELSSVALHLSFPACWMLACIWPAGLLQGSCCVFGHSATVSASWPHFVLNMQMVG